MVVTSTSAGLLGSGCSSPASFSFENSRVSPIEIPTPGSRVSVK